MVGLKGSGTDPSGSASSVVASVGTVHYAAVWTVTVTLRSFNHEEPLAGL